MKIGFCTMATGLALLAAAQYGVARAAAIDDGRVLGTSGTTELMKVYASPHALFVDAIDHGQATGALQGEVAEHFTREFGSVGILTAQAEVIGSGPGKDCKQLQIVFTKAEVDTPAGKTEAILRSELKYCRDGSPWSD